MGRAFTITDSAANVLEYIDAKKLLARSVLAERIDIVNSMLADRVRSNLSGGVLNSVSGKLLGTVKQIPTRFLGNSVISGNVTAGGPEAPYGIFFEEGGRGFYKIVPVNAKVLAFMQEGERIFARVVNHPPTPHREWFGPAVDEAQTEMSSQLQQAMGEVMR
jgi:hypothetical protein